MSNFELSHLRGETISFWDEEMGHNLPRKPGECPGAIIDVYEERKEEREGCERIVKGHGGEGKSENIFMR